jgi:signal peptide peptidase SppA
VNLSQLHKQPWLITPEAFGVIYSAAQSFFKEGVSTTLRAESQLLSVEGGVGTVVLRGPMMRNPDVIDQLVFGATDTEEVMAAVHEAVQRDDVQAILLDIDCPGGSVNGTPELAAAVATASRTKTVYAFSAGQMCSAAYWVASQCDAVYATPSARVGSIGVILPVVDSSEAFAKAGLKMEVFAAGKFKSAGTPGTSLTDEQKDWLQTEVEEIAADFRSAVLARGRKIPDEAMEGQTFSGRRAMRLNMAGMVDGKAQVMDRLRELHVREVDTTAEAMDITILETELAEAKASLAKLNDDAKAQESLLTEANDQITSLTTKAEAVSQELAAVSAEREQLASDLATARQTIESVSKRNSDLEAAEQDLEQRAAARAAEIVSETGNQAPANVTAAVAEPQAPKTPDIVEQFAAITDPAQQTAFWRQLTSQQKATILAASNK